MNWLELEIPAESRFTPRDPKPLDLVVEVDGERGAGKEQRETASDECQEVPICVHRAGLWSPVARCVRESRWRGDTGALGARFLVDGNVPVRRFE